jgi:hypothetical protein
MASIIPEIFAEMQVLPIDLKIIKFINQHGNVFGQNCYASYARIADAVGVTIRYVKARCRFLEMKTLLRIVRRKDPDKKNRNLVNIFSLKRPWLKELSYHDAYMAKKRRQLARQKDTAHPCNGDLAESPSLINQTIERTRNPEQFFKDYEKRETRRVQCDHPLELRAKAGDEQIMCLKCYGLLTNEG